MPPNRLKFLSGEFLQIHSFIQKERRQDDEQKPERICGLVVGRRLRVGGPANFCEKKQNSAKVGRRQEGPEDDPSQAHLRIYRRRRGRTISGSGRSGFPAKAKKLMDYSMPNFWQWTEINVWRPYSVCLLISDAKLETSYVLHTYISK